MEEHPWSSSLGGLQGRPGAAAQSAEPKGLKLEDSGTGRTDGGTETGIKLLLRRLGLFWTNLMCVYLSKRTL